MAVKTWVVVRFEDLLESLNIHDTEKFFQSQSQVEQFYSRIELLLDTVRTACPDSEFYLLTTKESRSLDWFLCDKMPSKLKFLLNIAGNGGFLYDEEAVITVAQWHKKKIILLEPRKEISYENRVFLFHFYLINQPFWVIHDFLYSDLFLKFSEINAFLGKKKTVDEKDSLDDFFIETRKPLTWKMVLKKPISPEVLSFNIDVAIERIKNNLNQYK